MKKNWIISTLFLLAGSLPAIAQWTGTDPTYRAGNVGIGISSAASVTHRLSIESNSDWAMRLKDINGGTSWYVASSGTGFNAGAGKLLFSGSTNSLTSILVLTPTKLGVLNVNPRAQLDVGITSPGVLASALGRRNEGDGTGDGTYLGVRTHDTQPINVKSFSLEHSFNGNINSSIGFFRGDAYTGGFITFSTNNNTERMRILPNGNVCIGNTVANGYKLAVDGVIGAREVNVNTSTWGDYVFDADYSLLPLTEVEKYIAAHHHLPEMPSAAEVIEKGINVGAMNALLLKKIEELTLHIISQEKKMNEQDARIKALENKN